MDFHFVTKTTISRETVFFRILKSYVQVTFEKVVPETYAVRLEISKNKTD